MLFYMFSSEMLLRTCLLQIRFHYKRDHDAIWELLQMMLVWRLQRQTLVAMGLCLVLPDTWTPLWQMNCKDTVEIWEATLSLFLLFSNHFCSLETCLWFEDELWELCMFRRVVQVPWQAAPSRVNTETHGNRSGARASAQASHQAPADPWQQAHDRAEKPRETCWLIRTETIFVDKEGPWCMHSWKNPSRFSIFFYCKRKGNKSLPIVLLSLLHLALVMLVFYKVISAFLLGSVVDK